MRLSPVQFTQHDATGVPVPSVFRDDSYSHADKTLFTLAEEEALRAVAQQVDFAPTRHKAVTSPPMRETFITDSVLDVMYENAHATTLEYALRYAVKDAFRTRPGFTDYAKLEATRQCFDENERAHLACHLCGKEIAITSAQEVEHILQLAAQRNADGRGPNKKMPGWKREVQGGILHGKQLYDSGNWSRSIIQEEVEFDHMGPTAMRTVYDGHRPDPLHIGSNYRWENIRGTQLYAAGLRKAREIITTTPSIHYALLSETILSSPCGLHIAGVVTPSMSFREAKHALFNMPEHIRPSHSSCNNKDGAIAHEERLHRSQKELEKIWNPDKTTWGTIGR